MQRVEARNVTHILRQVKKLSKFSKALNVPIFITAVITNKGIGNGIGGIGKGIKKNDIYALQVAT